MKKKARNKKIFSKPDNFLQTYAEMKKKGLPMRRIASVYGVTRQALYNWLNQEKIFKEKIFKEKIDVIKEIDELEKKQVEYRAEREKVFSDESDEEINELMKKFLKTSFKTMTDDRAKAMIIVKILEIATGR